MSANDSRSVARLTSRVVRVRNRCLAALAARRSLPVPSDADLAALGDDASLVDLLTRWEQSHAPVAAPPRRGFDLPTPPRSRWPVVLKAAGVILAAGLGFAVGERFLPRADAQSSAGAVESPWVAVNDSVANALNATLVRARETRETMTFSAADIAALIFRSARRRTAFVDSIEARADSLVSIRGRLPGKSAFELRGILRLVRRGVAELQVTSLAVDSIDVDPTQVTRLVSRGRARMDNSDRLRFDVPLDVTALSVIGGRIELARDRPSGAKPRVVRQ